MRRPTPPRRAVAFLRWAVGLEESAESILGDLTEEFGQRSERDGPHHASRWFWRECLRIGTVFRLQGRGVRSEARSKGRRLEEGQPNEHRLNLDRSGGGLSWLDFKLGLRMLARYPALTVVGSLAMALGIAIGATVFQLVSELIFPDHPYAEVDRIVGIQNVNTLTVRADGRALHDVATWRSDLGRVERIGARRTGLRTNLDIGDGAPEPVTGVSISATAFELAPVPPVLGRPLLVADEAPGAPDVAVLSYEIWQARFAGDPDIVGRVVRLGGVPTTVVGVMPSRFTLHVPSNDLIYPGRQELWLPFRLDPGSYAPGEGPRVTVFGRLREGTTPAEAQAELSALGANAALTWPETHAYLQPEIVTFANPFGIDRGLGTRGVLSLAGAFIVAVMAMLCGNVALLLFARAATREGELVVRSALGASRTRIVSQLFAEALALSAVALALGWAGASIGLSWFVGVIDSIGVASDVGQPWLSGTLSPRTISYAAVLALAGAFVAGVLPGVKVTARGGAGGLQGFAGRGAVAPLGRLWDVIIVIQVALTAMFIPVAFLFGQQTWEIRSSDLGLPASEYLTFRLEMDGDRSLLGAAAAPEPSDFMSRYQASQRELARRLEAERVVTGVTTAEDFPGAEHRRRVIELEGSTGMDPFTMGEEAQVASVDPDFFEIMGAPIVTGRGFGSGDLAPDAQAVVVNESFVREILRTGAGGAVGRRFRYPRPPTDGTGRSAEDGTEEPWLQIVGVVEDIAMSVDPALDHNAGVYHLRWPADSYPARMAVRVPSGAADFAPRLRDIARQVSPALRVHQSMSMDEAVAGILMIYAFFFRVMLLTGGFALLLTIAGIHALIAFAVSRRTREIGVRVALGADRARIAESVLSPMARRVATGVILGALPVTYLSHDLGAWRVTPVSGGLVIAYVILMIGTCMIPCIVPTLRALRIQPTEALSAEG